MKKILIATLAALLALSIVLAASADGWKELKDPEMTAEELYETGKAAKDAGDYAKALEYCQLAADLGSSEAIKEIGNLYFFGLGVETDYDKAFEYYQQAAELGNFNAINNLGNCYLNGRGVEKNDEEAVKYFQMAAEQGVAAAHPSSGL